MKFSLWRFVLPAFFVFMAADAVAQSSVWMVRAGKATVYLAGSVHLLRSADHPLPAEFFRAYDNSRRIVFEVMPGEMERPENMEKYLRASVYSDGKTLREHLPAEIYERVEIFCKDKNYPMNRLAYLRPGFFLITLTVFEMNKLGADLKKGVDYYFKEKALQDGKTIGALETAEEQIKFLSLLDAALDARQMMESIEELKMLEEYYTKTVAAWKKGDEEEIDRVYLKRLKGYPEAYQTIITDRNKRWVKIVETFLGGEENTMVVGGVAHFAGEEGLLNLLRQRGYKLVKLQKR
ncbi:MAG TPA: TraB/GumN family protein [Smithellaceae bacterium]|nr:TraB/GumN family protein [Smithellaceae bacterium]HRS88858.1 TraB/GumN family protein [Smithellaceae bacterium]HRV26792.1 TraB/GumN family protein [Smithellaceae bacterium]